MVEATGLSLVRGGKRVLEEVSLRVTRGKVLGLLGRNGAGKTTTLKILCGLLKQDAGSVRFAEDRRPKIGSLVETPGFYPNLTGLENLLLFSQDRSAAARRNLEETLDLLGLTKASETRVGRYSLGMKQRLGIARALAGQPELVILDEPINGLDPHGIKDVRDIIRTLARERGISFLVSSHILSEVELVADGVTVIEEGRTVATIEVPSSGTAGSGDVDIEVDQPEVAADRILRAWPTSVCEVVSSDKLRVCGESAGPGALNRLLVGAGHTVSSLVPRRWSLEAEVMRHMRRDL